MAMGQNIQVGARDAADSFNRFVEGDDGESPARGRQGPAPERQDFWDDFASHGSSPQDSQKNQQGMPRSGVIGTTAMKKGPTGPAASTATAAPGGAGTAANTASTTGAKGQEDWGDDNW